MKILLIPKENSFSNVLFPSYGQNSSYDNDFRGYKKQKNVQVKLCDAYSTLH